MPTLTVETLRLEASLFSAAESRHLEHYRHARPHCELTRFRDDLHERISILAYPELTLSYQISAFREKLTDRRLRSFSLS